LKGIERKRVGIMQLELLLRPQGGRPRRCFSMIRAISCPGIALGLWLLALGPAVGSAARQQPNTTQTVDVDTVGPKVGETLPEFSLRDQGGRVHSLKSLIGSKGAVIVFFRSADW
jgi:hypothetical protein